MILLEKQESLALFGGFLSSSYQILEKHTLGLAYSAGWKELIPMFDPESLTSLGNIAQDPEIIEDSLDPNVGILREVLHQQRQVIEKFSKRNPGFAEDELFFTGAEVIEKEFYFQDYNQLLQDTFSYLVGLVIDSCDVVIGYLESETGLELKGIYDGNIESLRQYADEDMGLIFDFVETINTGLEQLMKQEVLSA